MFRFFLFIAMMFVGAAFLYVGMCSSPENPVEMHKRQRLKDFSKYLQIAPRVLVEVVSYMRIKGDPDLLSKRSGEASKQTTVGKEVSISATELVIAEPEPEGTHALSRET